MAPSRASSASLCLLLSLAATSSAAQDLADVVPDDAYFFVHAVHDPGLAFVDAYTYEVFQAVVDARFDELLLSVMQTGGASEDEITEVKNHIDTVGSLLASVKWSDLVEQEVVYAEVFEPRQPGSADVNIPGRSILMACRPHAEDFESLERSMRGLMASVQYMSEDELLFEVEKQGPADTRVYRLRKNEHDDAHPDEPLHGDANGRSGPQYEHVQGMILVQVAFHDDRVLIGMGEGAFARCLSVMRGESNARLTATRRYKDALGELPADAPQRSYFDVDALLDGISGQLDGLFDNRRGRSSDIWRSMLNDVMDLGRCVDTVVSVTHGQGSTTITEHWTRFDPEALAAGNPIALGLADLPSSSDLLAYVPADATSFDVSSGFDCRPLYRWFLDRFEAYAPNASDIMVVWNTVQAVLGLNVERDLLSWVGSPSVTVTLPAPHPAQPDAEDTVTITKLRDVKGARKLLERIEDVYAAFVPPMMVRLAQVLDEEMGAAGFLPHISLAPAEGDFPGFTRLEITMPPFVPVPIPDCIYGLIGDRFVTTTSEEALHRVLAAANGEAPGLSEHALMTGAHHVPDRAVTGIQLVDNARTMRELREGVAIIGGMLPGFLGGLVRDPEERAAIMEAVAGTLSRLQQILAHVDFIEETVTYTEIRADGLAEYGRSSTRFEAPDERRRRRAAEGSDR